MTSTAAVVVRVPRRVGHVTRRASARTSIKYLRGLNPEPFVAGGFLRESPFGLLTDTIILKSKAALIYMGGTPRQTGNEVAGVEGLEPATSGFGDRRSSQLSYTPSGT